MKKWHVRNLIGWNSDPIAFIGKMKMLLDIFSLSHITYFIHFHQKIWFKSALGNFVLLSGHLKKGLWISDFMICILKKGRLFEGYILNCIDQSRKLFQKYPQYCKDSQNILLLTNNYMPYTNYLCRHENGTERSNFE